MLQENLFARYTLVDRQGFIKNNTFQFDTLKNYFTLRKD